MGPKNELLSGWVNEPSGFEPLRVYCSFKQVKSNTETHNWDLRKVIFRKTKTKRKKKKKKKKNVHVIIQF